MENERARLERIYSVKSDLELAELLRDAAGLTDIARSALEDELAKRGIEPLATQTRANVASERPEEQEESKKVSGPLVMVKRFRDLTDAFVAKSILDSAQIDSFLADENIVRMDWLYSNLVGGAKLMVRPEDFEEATALLNEPTDVANEEFEDGDGEAR